ncbi:MAG: nicotinate phosphoribosyltransferase [Bacteroidota bacterium]
MIKALYRENLSLLTDLYQLTMGYGYWKKGMAERRACFQLFYRKPPFTGDRGIICAGLQPVCEVLDHFQLSVSDIQYLGSLRGADQRPLFNESFLNYLQRMEFSCDIQAIPEGTFVLPHCPIVRVEGPLLQVQLIETLLLNMINFSSLIATKAARIRQAAGTDPVLEFGLRRAQGPNGALLATRSAYIGGVDGTSNVLAGKLLGIPVKGTHAHSWVMSFPSEMEAFQAYAEGQPNNVILLVDTYDTLQGVKNAIRVAKELQKEGQRLLGIRLDSGDLAHLSKKARQLLDEAGLFETKIVASNDLDEYRIAELKEQGAQIDTWGIGTRLITSFDRPALGGVYKLSAIQNEAGEWESKMKYSNDQIKRSNPGIINPLRVQTEDSLYVDVLYNELQGSWEKEAVDPQTGANLPLSIKGINPLLTSIYRKGSRIYSFPTIHTIRQKSLESWKNQKVFISDQVLHSPSLWMQKQEFKQPLNDENTGSPTGQKASNKTAFN